MEEYLKKYPKEEQNVGALRFAFGMDETERILKQALAEGKKVKLITDKNKIDWLDYKFI